MDNDTYFNDNKDMTVDEKYIKIKEYIKMLSDIEYKDEHFIFHDNKIFYKNEGKFKEMNTDWAVIMRSEIIQLYDDLSEIIKKRISKKG